MRRLSRSSSLRPIEELNVFFICKTSFSDEFLQKTYAKRSSFVNRYREMNIVPFFYQDVVTPFNVVHPPTIPFEGSDMLIAACPWQSMHALSR